MNTEDRIKNIICRLKGGLQCERSNLAELQERIDMKKKTIKDFERSIKHWEHSLDIVNNQR